jgi:hypothetical protein
LRQFGLRRGEQAWWSWPICFFLEESVKLQSKFRALTFIGILSVLSVAPLSAQKNSLPSPKAASCWESLSALRACSLEQYNRELDYEQRCTSYPEYQCAPASEQSASPTHMAKNRKKTKSDKTAVAVSQPSPAESMDAGATSLPPDAK